MAFVKQETLDQLRADSEELKTLKANLEGGATSEAEKISALETQLAESTQNNEEMARQVEDLQNAIAAKDEEISRLTTEAQQVQVKTEELNSVISDLRALKNTWQPATRENVAGGKNNVDAAKPVDMERVREIQAKL